MAGAGVAGLGLLLGAGAVAQRGHMRRISADPDHALLSAPPRGRSLSARSADGTILHAERFGAPDSPTIVLAHGWTETLSYWTYVIRQLSERGLGVIAYDLRGHGASEPARSGEYSLERFGEDVEAVLQGCVPDGRRVVLAGHSLGAMSIAAWAEHHEVGARVCAAALLNTGVGDLIAEHLLVPVPAIAWAVKRTPVGRRCLCARVPLSRVSTPLSCGAIRYVAFGPTARTAQVAFYERMLVTCPPDVRSDVGLAMSEMALEHALPRLSVPTLVMAGARDRLTPPSHARRIAQALPDLTKLIVLPDTGHMGPLERPREVAEALSALSLSLSAGVAPGTEAGAASKLAAA